MTTDEYHYTECGIDYIYLVDGYEFVDTPQGRQVVVQNIDGLHAAIGKFLVNHKKDLTGDDVRFLRHEMLMSQATLAKLLDVGEQTVHRWETGKTEASKPASALIRLLYREQNGGNKEIQGSLKRIADLEDEIDETLRLMETNEGWKTAA
jgi:DNA-binding transcriptional regulator YiaG